MVTNRKGKPLYIPGSIMDRLSQLTPSQGKEYQRLRAEGRTIKEAVDKVRPQIDQPCNQCSWKEVPDPRCTRCRGSGRIPLHPQLEMTIWEKETIT